jgi:tetratricopeptide (TPR) repeat protein
MSLPALVFLLALAASPQASDSLKLKSGSVVKGRATAYDSQEGKLSFRTEDGKDMTFTLDQLDQRSVYQVNSSLVPKDSARGQLQLGNFARDIDLFYQARRCYHQAEKADPSLKPEIDKERALGRQRAAAFCMRNAQEGLAKNKTKDALHWLELLVQNLPDQPEAEQAALLLDQHYARERNSRDDELEREQTELIQKDLKKGKELYDRMIQRTQEGLTARNSGKAEDLWKDAIRDGTGALKEIERLAKKYPDDPRVQNGAEKYRRLTIEQLVCVHLHLASNASIQSSYNEALREVNAALALDPNNARALAQRARIEQAASEGFDLYWF